MIKDKIEFENLKSVLLDYAIALQNKYKDNLWASDRVATGDLVTSVQYQTDFDDNTYIISLNLEEWWKYVEYGTKPHFPPPSAILKWIKAKPVLPRPLANGKLPTPNQLAYLIGRKISEVGTQGSHDLEKTIEEINAEYEELIAEALQKDLSDNIDSVWITLFKP